MWCKLLNGGAHFRVWMLFPGLVFIFCIYQSPLIQTTGKSRKQQDTGKGWLRGSVWKMEASGNGLLVKEKTPTSRWHFRDWNLRCQEKITRKEVFEEVAEILCSHTPWWVGKKKITKDCKSLLFILKQTKGEKNNSYFKETRFTPQNKKMTYKQKIVLSLPRGRKKKKFMSTK